MHAWLLSTVLALGPAPAQAGPSRVEIDVSGLEQHMPDDVLHRFHGELLMRLLEAGHGIGDDGDVRLTVISTGESVVVECEVGDRRERIEVDDADAAVLGLELVHRAVDLVARCSADAPGSAGAVMVVDSDASIATDELLVELAGAPITVTMDAERADWRVCVRDAAAFVLAREHACDEVEEPRRDDPREAIERWQASLEPEPPELEQPELEQPEPEPPEPEPPERPAPRPRAWGPSFGAGVGVQLRFPGVGGAIRVDVAALHRKGVLVGALGSLAPSVGDRLVVLDALALALVGWRGQLADRVALRPSAGIGAAVHRFEFEGEPVGHRVDLAIRGALELELRVAARIYLTLGLAATISPRRIEHQLRDELLWTSRAVRLDALAGVRFDWPNARSR